MKKYYFTFCVLLICHVANAQLYPKWIKSYLSDLSIYQVHEGTIDSLSNYYSVITNITTTPPHYEVKKIDSMGTELWNRVIWPDSIVPDTVSSTEVLLYNAPGNNILTLCRGDIGLLKLLDGNGNELRRCLLPPMFYCSAFASDDGHYYVMSVDTVRYVHNFILDSAMNIIHHDSSEMAGGGFSNDTYVNDIYGNTFGFYTDSRQTGSASKIFRFRNEQLVDSFVASHYGTLKTDKFGYRYLFNGDGPTTKFDTSWNVVWTNPGCHAFRLEFDSQNNFYTLDVNTNGSMPVQKYDSNGNLLWSHSFSQPGMYSAKPWDIVVDSYDHVIVTGKFNDGSLNTDKVFVSHLDPNGHIDEYYEKYFPANQYPGINDVFVNDGNQLFYYIFSIDSIYYECLYSHSSPTISGDVYYDGNSNCQRDSNETFLNNINVSCSPSGFYYQTSDSGHFYFHVPDGTYQIDCGIPVNWTQTCPANSVTVTNGVAGGYVSIGLRAQPGVDDLQIDFAQPSVRANRDMPLLIHFQNLGSTTVSGTVRLNLDSIFTYVSALPLPDSVLTYSLSWNFTNLNPGESRQISVILHSGMYPTGTPFTNSVYIFGQFSDTYISDNTFSMNGELLGSVDPNEKYVQPKGNGINGYISTDDSILCYQIVFQNTGSDTAFYVMVIDTLDENLDPLSFRIGATSMACNYSLSGTGVLKFIFDPCTLPDSTTNEIQSHGFINYFIKTDDNLPNGTVIKNKADIYFDYNFPVTTNSTINTIDYTLAVNKIPEHDDLMTIYPNPASDILYLRIKNSRTKNRINIFSGSGINVKSLETYETNFSIPLNEFSNGTYFIQVQNEKGVDTKLFNLIKPERR